jgi:hypothetical protein
LWDVHVHLEWPRIAAAGVAELTVQYAANAAQGLYESGVTSIRTAGTPHFIDVALKRAFATGRLVGPRIFAGGWFLTTTAGHALGTGFARTCDGPTGFVRAIREQMENGVDHVKLNLSGGVFGPSWDRHWHSFLLTEELEAAFAICRQRGYPVMAHATNPDAVKAAVRLGAHSVEHGYIMDDECLTLFREHGTWYVPTLGITHLTPAQSATSFESCWVEQRGLTPDIVKRAEDAAPEHRRLVRESPPLGRQDGARLRPAPPARLGAPRDGAVGEGRRDASADDRGGDPPRRRSLRRRRRSGNGRGRKDRRSHRRPRQSARRHPPPALAAARPEGRPRGRRSPAEARA